MEIYKSDIGSAGPIMDMPFKILHMLREARIERIKEENKRQLEEQKKAEKERMKSMITKGVGKK